MFDCPDSKVHEANMGPIWGRQDQGEPHVGPMNFAIWVITRICTVLGFSPLDRDNTATISQTTFWNASFLMKM